MSAALEWYVNGKPQEEVEHKSFRAGDYLGHLWLVNTGTRPLEHVTLKDKQGRALFTITKDGLRNYLLCVGTINPGGRASCHAWVNQSQWSEGPLQIVAEEMMESYA